MTDFSGQFRKDMRYKRIGYNLNVIRQFACLVINPIIVDSFAALFNCTLVDRGSYSSWLGPELSSLGRSTGGSIDVFLLFQSLRVRLAP